MGPGLSHDPLLFVDACTWINLFATGRIAEILRALPYRFAASRYVSEEEVLTVSTGGESGSGSGGVQHLDLRALERAGQVEIADVETRAEIVELVRFAVELDDGEASTCALAVCRGGRVATDDRKALRVLGRLTPQILTHQTPELLQEWALAAEVRDDQVREVLAAVRDRGHFYPRRDAPAFVWWSGLLP